MLPGVEDIEKGCKIYEQFCKIETQKEHGICMIKIRLI
jgi:ASC-1-like (ASCH) protein